MFALRLLANAQTGSGGSIISILPIVLIFGVMYFLLLRPQRKRQKETARLQGGLAEGDEVILNSGIYGWISEINDDEGYVWLELAEKVEVRVSKSAIISRVSVTSTEAPATDDKS